MTVLALDTASPRPSVALRTRRGLFEESLPRDRRASEELLPTVRRVLASAGVTLGDCDRIAVCSGPGSFTGLRVGLATAWGLARARGIALETVSTLEAMAETARSADVARVVAVLDAGRGDLVCERFALDGPRALSLGPPVLRRVETLSSLAGMDRLVALPEDLVDPPAPPPGSSVASALAAAVERQPRGGAAGDLPLSAIYARPSAAEEKHGAA